MSNFGKRYMIQGADGPVEAQRPTDKQLKQLASLEYVGGDRVKFAFELAAQGLTLDAPVDVFGWDYWKTMQYRRQYGYSWVPAADQPNIQIAPGLWMPAEGSEEGLSFVRTPPLGAILVPASEQEDPNYALPAPVTPPPPPSEGVVSFGPSSSSSEFPGAFLVSVNNTVPPGTHATKDGAEYVFVILARGFTGQLKLWMPIGG